MGFEFAFERGHRIYNVPIGEYSKYKASKLSHVKFAYDVSWDWLMPVVEKISKIAYEEEKMEQYDGGIAQYTDYAYCRTFGMPDENGHPMVRINRMPLHTADTLIEATYAAVLEFIKHTKTRPE